MGHLGQLCTLLALIPLLCCSSSKAEQPKFLVAIVGEHQNQEHYALTPRAKNDEGFPIVPLPSSHPAKGATSSEFDHFFVSVRNDSGNSVRLPLWDSDWYDCLRFVITTTDGKTFQVKRPYEDWTMNELHEWVFTPDGMKIFTVDFINEDWEGLPAYGSIKTHQHFKIEAIFSYHDPETKKELVFHSRAVEAQNGF